jgi:retron-type reverse transcriptase
VLANLFMHYAFDTWLEREFPAVKFERYADLCRARHKSAYAESRVMPILVPDLLVRAVSGFPLSA